MVEDSKGPKLARPRPVVCTFCHERYDAIRVIEDSKGHHTMCVERPVVVEKRACATCNACIFSILMHKVELDDEHHCRFFKHEDVATKVDCK